MAFIKTQKEIEIILEGGTLMGQILESLVRMVEPGITTTHLDKEAERLIRNARGEPSFKGYTTHGAPPYPTTLCASVNEAVVHAPAFPGVTLKSGDILSIDIGMKWRGLYTDTAVTVAVGTIAPQAQILMDATYAALRLGIQQCVPGKTIADIGAAVERYIKPLGYGIVTDLVGHGVGHAVHEPPQIPNYFVSANKKIVIKEGMVLALEPMITAGGGDIETLDDGWTVVTRDRSLSAHFEHTVVISATGPVCATMRPNERPL